jgi:hypothetical protein
VFSVSAVLSVSSGISVSSVSAISNGTKNSAISARFHLSLLIASLCLILKFLTFLGKVF